MGDTGIAFFAGLGAALWVYLKFSRRSTAGEVVKNLAPAALAGFVVFIASLAVLSAIFG